MWTFSTDKGIKFKFNQTIKEVLMQEYFDVSILEPGLEAQQEIKMAEQNIYQALGPTKLNISVMLETLSA